MEDQKPDIKKLVTDAIAKFRDDYEHKNYSARHPELGKMVSCKICGLRHRSAKVCQERIAVPTAETRKGVYGAAQFNKKRIRPHHSHRLLRVVQLTQDLFPKYYPDYISDPTKAMQAARGEAIETLVRAEKKVRKAVRQRQQESRKVNRYGR
jgi:hypothetical protein